MYLLQIKELEDKFDDDTESIITNERYVYISSIIGECCDQKAQRKDKLTTSDKIDKIVTNRWLALPIFAVDYVHCILCIGNNRRRHCNRLGK